MYNASTSLSSSPTTPSTVTTTYQVIDDDDNGSVVTKGSFNGMLNSAITNQAIIDNNAAELLNKYVLTSPDDSNLLTNNSGTITIHVNHKSETVTDTHNATFIVYEDSSTPGNVGPASGVSKKYIFTRTGTKDLVTGQTTWSAWSSPGTLRVDRYTFTVTADSPNTNVTITYKGMLINTDAAPHKVTNTVNFIDAAGKTIKTVSVSADDQNKPMDISNLISDGYQLVDLANASLTSGDNGSFFNVEVQKASADSTDPTPISPDHPGDPHDSDSGQSDPNNPTPIIVNTVEFIDDQGKTVGSINVKVNAVGQKIILNSDSIPAGYKLVDSTSLVLTAKDNGATIQVKVAADANTDDNSGQNNPAPITPGDSGTAVSVESGDAAPASGNSVLPQTGNSANAHKAKTAGIMMLLTELFASMGLMQKRNKNR